MKGLELFKMVYTRVTAKDVASMLGVSLSCANRYLLDIKKEYKLKKVCLWHMINYFKLPYETTQKCSKLLKNA